MRSFVSCILHQILLWPSDQGWGRQDVWHAWERWEMHTEFVRKPEGEGLHRRIILNWILWRCGLDSDGSRQGPLVGCCKLCDKLPKSIKCRKCLGLLHICNNVQNYITAEIRCGILLHNHRICSLWSSCGEAARGTHKQQLVCTAASTKSAKGTLTC
jgi:hypothetical protein